MAFHSINDTKAWIFVICFAGFTVSGYCSERNSKQKLVQQKLSIEVTGITVVPHVISGEIPSYRNDKGNYELGANIRIFIRNTSSKGIIYPKVFFNNSSGAELLKKNIVSYCDAPEIRKENKLSSIIPAGAMDCYLLNVIDSNFYSNGIVLKVTDTFTGLSFTKNLKIEKPRFYASRIAFASAKGSVVPDGFYAYFVNESRNPVSLKSLKIWTASDSVSQHYWKKSIYPSKLKWYSDSTGIAPEDLGCMYVHTDKIPFGETIIEFELTSTEGNKKLFYLMKPMTIAFDIGFGWGEKYIAESDAYCKTLKLMHLTSVNGNADNFFNNKKRSQEYLIKRISRLETESASNDTGILKYIHGAEHFGEPQFDKKPAQKIYNYYTSYRHSMFPATLTLSHEPGYSRYAGLVDLPHFNAYRVVAPHADKWGDYKKYGAKNVKWGCPLETIGDYMRSLNKISYPNRVAAWSQAMSNGWKSSSRITYPNNFEIRVQAYEAIANGATSLYWFTLGGKHLIKHRQCLNEIQKINRELMVVDDLLVVTIPYWFQNKFNNLDLNVLAGPGYAIAFAIDLKYKSSQSNEFVPEGIRNESMTFKIPAYLQGCNTALKITHQGILKINFRTKGSEMIIQDEFHTSAMYLIYDSRKKDFQKVLTLKLNKFVAQEKSCGFDPIHNEFDFEILKSEIMKIEAGK